MGYSYYTGEEYEQECDVESGMDILNFILPKKKVLSAMNEDKILQMFFDIGRWTKAIEKRRAERH